MIVVTGGNGSMGRSMAACGLALTVPLDGHHAYFIVAPDTMATAPTAELLARYYPGVPWRGPAPHPTQAPISTARAAQDLGWRAGHSWRSA